MMTLSTAEADLRLGQVVRHLRKKSALTLKALAHLTGHSESFLSQFELGQTQASIASLRRIADALGVTLAEIFDSTETTFGKEGSVLRHSEWRGMGFGSDATKHFLSPVSFRNVEVFHVNLEPGGSTGDASYAHGHSEELIMVLSGKVKFELSLQTLELVSHDSISFNSAVPHRAINVGKSNAELMWIVSPPSGGPRSRPEPLKQEESVL